MPEAAIEQEQPATADDAEIPVVVAVHIRPLIYDELVEGYKQCLSVAKGEPQVCCGHHTFSFDHVYGGGGLPPSGLYQDCVEPLVQGVFSGYNATVFAYGQTGSGKTYTMGSQCSAGEVPQGVIPDVLTSMFNRIAQAPDTDFTLRVGFIEIHKEEIHDLLLSASQPRPSITIREMPNGSMCVAGATEIEIDLSAGAAASKAQVLEILTQGSMSRATSMTMMNARSSRSHAVFSLSLEQRKEASSSRSDQDDAGDDKEASDSEKAGQDGDVDMTYLCAKMLLVDLAGSERVKRTMATGARLQEGIHINQGLLSLANVIQALVDGHKHVPYRNSKLTRLLQDSLGHNSRTVMIACVSPADANLEETINTLRYANRARNIKNKPIVNRDPTAAEILLLRQQLSAARAEVYALRSQLQAHARANLPAGGGQVVEDLEEQLAAAHKQLESANNRLAQSLAANEAWDLSGHSHDDADGGGDAALRSRLEQYQSRILQLEAEVQQARLGPSTRRHHAARRAAPTEEAMASESALVPSLSTPKRQYGEDLPMLPTPESGRDAERNAMMQRLSRLQEELHRKESQMVTLSTTQVDTVKTQYEALVSDLMKQQNTLKQKQLDLQRRVKEQDFSRVNDRKQEEKRYARQKKEVDEATSRVKQLENDRMRMERVMRKSEDMVSRLKNDIGRIKNQKSGLMKQISEIQHDYATFKRGKQKEITALKKDGRKAEFEVRRLNMLNEKQKAVLQRKIQEAEDAKKRLAAKRAIASGMAPRRTQTMAPRAPSSTQAGPARSASSAALRTQSAKPNADAGAQGVASANVPPISPRDLDQVPLQPNPNAPQLRDIPSVVTWLWNEIDNANPVHDLRKVLEGEIAQRSELAKKQLEKERLIVDIDLLPEDQREEQQQTRASIVAAQRSLEDAIESHSNCILKLQAELDAAGKPEDDCGLPSPGRPDSSAGNAAAAQRFSSITNPRHAQQMLRALFQCALSLKDQLEDQSLELTNLRDNNEIYAIRHELDAHEIEMLQGELADQRARTSEGRRLTSLAASIDGDRAGHDDDNHVALASPSSTYGVDPPSSTTSPVRPSLDTDAGVQAPWAVDAYLKPSGSDGVASIGGGLRASAPWLGNMTPIAEEADGQPADERDRDASPHRISAPALALEVPALRLAASSDSSRRVLDHDALDAQYHELLSEMYSLSRNLGGSGNGQLTSTSLENPLYETNAAQTGVGISAASAAASASMPQAKDERFAADRAAAAAHLPQTSRQRSPRPSAEGGASKGRGRSAEALDPDSKKRNTIATVARFGRGSFRGSGQVSEKAGSQAESELEPESDEKVRKPTLVSPKLTESAGGAAQAGAQAPPPLQHQLSDGSADENLSGRGRTSDIGYSPHCSAAILARYDSIRSSEDAQACDQSRSGNWRADPTLELPPCSLSGTLSSDNGPVRDVDVNRRDGPKPRRQSLMPSLPPMPQPKPFDPLPIANVDPAVLLTPPSKNNAGPSEPRARRVTMFGRGDLDDGPETRHSRSSMAAALSQQTVDAWNDKRMYRSDTDKLQASAMLGFDESEQHRDEIMQLGSRGFRDTRAAQSRRYTMAAGMEKAFYAGLSEHRAERMLQDAAAARMKAAAALLEGTRKTEANV